MVERFKQYRLQIISFVTGFALLTYELAAARVLAPSIGSSTYVWTSVIGVIIAALSLGFFVGGRIADSRNRPTDLVALLLLASVMAVATLVGYEGLLDSIVASITDSRMQAIVAALVLFAPTSFFIGTTSPYLAKLNVQSLKSTGQAIASLDMFNAIGGITGTFVTGFILFGYIGAHQAIGLVVILLLALSWLIAPRIYMSKRIILSAILSVIALTPVTTIQGIVKIDTPSAHYEVINGFIDQQPVVGLVTGPTGTQSAVYQNGISDPVFWYTREASRLAIGRQPDSILVLGGGAFTLPQYLSEQLPDSTIDVVEIDPELETISREYFGYTNPTNVTEFFTDARAYVNQTKQRYDVIIVDVYGDTSIPFTFMTKEYGAALARALNQGGIVIANIIGGMQGECRQVLGAVDAAYRSSLPNVVYSNESGEPEERANHIVVYSIQPVTLKGMRTLPPFNQKPYTDNFAPSERLYYDCQKQARS
ncbi:fused MFS/spermidine synthase [Candidatus Saccharibacteria bacterium]|nr:fused MFS/spermidine synthase [Candidatus Saccharibacteria bacterium]